MFVATVNYRSPNAPKEFTQSLKDTGFAVLSNHPIEESLIYDTYAEWEAFFKSQSKFDYLFNAQDQSGYFPFKSENAKDHKIKDLKEFYHLYKKYNLPQGMSSKSWQLFDQLTETAQTLLGWVEDHTPADVKALFKMPLRKMVVNSPKTLFRMLHYPPLEGSEEQGAIRAAAHEDINLLTLLPSSTAPGLQVKDNTGKWYDVECNPGQIVINSGDMLKEASGGYYGSTTHQVINPLGDAAKKSRYSMPLFLHPNPEAQLSDRHTADSYLNERLRELGLKT